jgi:hypothetical protein
LLKVETAFVVVDALDECADRGCFFRGLLSLSEENPNVKLLLTSRYEVELQRIIYPVASHHLTLEEHVRSDIRMYLTHETATCLDQGTLKLRHESLAADIADAIEEKTDGM